MGSEELKETESVGLDDRDIMCDGVRNVGNDEGEEGSDGRR